jgi:PTH1 family peptidyl-tRNA hydrolase
MNHSGLAVKEFIGNCLPAGEAGKLEIGNLVVIHDDLDIPLGKFKIQQGVGPLLHNGIASIENAIGTKDFFRVRIGVDNRTPENRVDGETYVLQDFTPEEKKIIFDLFPQIFSRLKNELLLQE